MSAPVRRPMTPTMRALAAALVGYQRIALASGRGRRVIAEVDRDLRVRVDAVTPVGDGVVEVRFVPRDGGALPAWHPGAHVDVLLPSGTLRQYSLCGTRSRPDEYRIAVRAVPGGTGSAEVHALAVGTELVLRGPRNAFPFIRADRYLFLAGGIGVTPIRPMVHDAAARGADWALVLTGRDRASMPFVDELVALDPARVHVRPDTEFGVPTGGELLSFGPGQAALYCCGPPPMVDAVRRAVPDPRVTTLHTERFSPPPVRGGEPFELVLARTGAVVEVGAAESALEAVRRVAPDVAYSCRQGFCGTCVVRVLGGEVEHRDHCLTPAQQAGTAERSGEVALCVSRGTGRLTLDL